MASTNLKLESGIQLLARLTKKSSIEQFYPVLFGNGPKLGDFIEIYSEGSTTCLLAELIIESLILKDLGGPETNVILFNTDGKITTDNLINLAKCKVWNHINKMKAANKLAKYDLDLILNSMLQNLFVLEIYDTTQFYTSIQNLENILIKNPNISLIVFDTLTAFYWDEQSFKVTKMDFYIKKLIFTIQKVVKDFKVTVIYSRPEYFSSSKEPIENLEPCYENSTLDYINYRLQVIFNDNDVHEINVRTYNTIFKKMFNIINDEIMWL